MIITSRFIVFRFYLFALVLFRSGRGLAPPAYILTLCALRTLGTRDGVVEDILLVAGGLERRVALALECDVNQTLGELGKRNTCGLPEIER